MNKLVPVVLSLSMLSFVPSGYAQNYQPWNSPPAQTNQNQSPNYQPWKNSPTTSNQNPNQPQGQFNQYNGSRPNQNPQTNAQTKIGPGKPSGGCLKYGAAGALGGHVANHGVLGALAGCATGAWVKHKSKERYRDTGHY